MLTHMSPEVMTTGKQSKAADVYSFAIVMSKLYTGELAFKGRPAALLPHQLAEECWAANAESRPTFAGVLQSLRELAHTDGTSVPSPVQLQQRAADGAAGAVGARAAEALAQEDPLRPPAAMVRTGAVGAAKGDQERSEQEAPRRARRRSPGAGGPWPPEVSGHRRSPCLR
ncbi:hypothetical protein FOA52_013641 [Chlamydomonas sp. UWO 241]|nr:hypothetical protein FOA52_013641 [Chlamydomonas sp. UWO 241]